MLRFMMRISEAIAKQNGCKALVTGREPHPGSKPDYGGFARDGVVHIPPRPSPLIGFDKTEIVSIAEKSHL
jgi:adenylyl- and sulfurtransferase ThiI